MGIVFATSPLWPGSSHNLSGLQTTFLHLFCLSAVGKGFISTLLLWFYQDDSPCYSDTSYVKPVDGWGSFSVLSVLALASSIQVQYAGWLPLLHSSVSKLYSCPRSLAISQHVSCCRLACCFLPLHYLAVGCRLAHICLWPQVFATFVVGRQPRLVSSQQLLHILSCSCAEMWNSPCRKQSWLSGPSISLIGSFVVSVRVSHNNLMLVGRDCFLSALPLPSTSEQLYCQFCLPVALWVHNGRHLVLKPSLAIKYSEYSSILWSSVSWSWFLPNCPPGSPPPSKWSNLVWPWSIYH